MGRSNAHIWCKDSRHNIDTISTLWCEFVYFSVHAWNTDVELVQDDEVWGFSVEDTKTAAKWNIQWTVLLRRFKRANERSGWRERAGGDLLQLLLASQWEMNLIA